MLDLDTFYLGPFTKIAGNPVLGPRPRAESNFSCPWHGSVVGWEEKDIFNPAAIVKGGRVHLLYRAEDNVGAFAGTSRIGLATSSTGLEFKSQDRRGAPVLYPAPLERDCCTKAAKQSNLCEVHTHASTKARAHTYTHTYEHARAHILTRTQVNCVKDGLSGMAKAALDREGRLTMSLYEGDCVCMCVCVCLCLCLSVCENAEGG